MERGVIAGENIPGGISLRETLESGQSYLWEPVNGELYSDTPPEWYEIALEDTIVRVRQNGTDLEWVGTGNPRHHLNRLLRLDDDLDEIYHKFPDQDLLTEAVDRYRGLRIVRDPPFPCLISFICSTQMRVERIHSMQQKLRETFGDTRKLGSRTVHAFPRPCQLATATENQLREIKLGYRAPYVLETAQMVANGEIDPLDAASLPYEEARRYLTQFTGVGQKVADCVLLFSLGFLEAVPLDTWINTAIDNHFPECRGASYTETSRAIRGQLGGEVAGYAQTYLFHHLRTLDRSEHV